MPMSKARFLLPPRDTFDNFARRLDASGSINCQHWYATKPTRKVMTESRTKGGQQGRRLETVTAVRSSN